MSKQSVQQGRSRVDARSVLSVREHGKRARSPLADSFNIPDLEILTDMERASITPSSEPTGKDIKALLRLLSDPDPAISATIHQHLVASGTRALPYLTQAQIEQPAIQERLSQIIQEIQFVDLEHTFQTLTHHGIDLELGAFLLARIAYPQLDPQPYSNQLDHIASNIKSRLPANPSNQHLLSELIRSLFEDLGFRGNTENYYDPDNSFLHRVLDQQRGIPITLCVLCILVANRLNLSLDGIGMPGHFLVKWEPGRVFIDCFNRGAFLAQADCEQFLRESGYEVKAQYFLPTAHHRILLRMINNLIGAYAKREEPLQVTKLQRLAHILADAEKT